MGAENIQIDIASVSVRKHKERHRGPECWMEPTEETRPAVISSDYDLAHACDGNVWVDGKPAKGDTFAAARLAILEHIVRERRHFLGNALKGWARGFREEAERAGLAGPRRSFTLASTPTFYSEWGAAVCQRDEESPILALDPPGKDGAVEYVWDHDRNEKWVFTADGGAWHGEQVDWTPPPVSFYVSFEEQLADGVDSYQRRGEQVWATDEGGAVNAFLNFVGHPEARGWCKAQPRLTRMNTSNVYSPGKDGVWRVG